jgi:hypothetical protein
MLTLAELERIAAQRDSEWAKSIVGGLTKKWLAEGGMIPLSLNMPKQLIKGLALAYSGVEDLTLTQRAFMVVDSIVNRSELHQSSVSGHHYKLTLPNDDPNIATIHIRPIPRRSLNVEA